MQGLFSWGRDMGLRDASAQCVVREGGWHSFRRLAVTGGEGREAAGGEGQ